MHRNAVVRACVAYGGEKRAREEPRVAHFNGIQRTFGKGAQERVQPFDEARHVAQERAAERRKLEEERPCLGAETVETRLDELPCRTRRVEKVGIPAQRGTPSAAFPDPAPGTRGGRFDDEPEALRHLRRVLGVLRGTERRVEGTVDADGPEQGMLRVCRKTLARERRFVVRVIPDEPVPPRKEPRRRAEVERARDLQAERDEV